MPVGPGLGVRSWHCWAGPLEMAGACTEYFSGVSELGCAVFWGCGRSGSDRAWGSGCRSMYWVKVCDGSAICGGLIMVVVRAGVVWAGFL